MKLVYVSVPTTHRSLIDIEKTKEALSKIAVTVFGLEGEDVNFRYSEYDMNVPENNPVETSRRRIRVLSECLERMADCEYFIGFGYNIYDSPSQSICELEYQVANQFKLRCHIMSTDNVDCLKDIKERAMNPVFMPEPVNIKEEI